MLKLDRKINLDELEINGKSKLDRKIDLYQLELT
jgi:hypothetical protein